LDCTPRSIPHHDTLQFPSTPRLLAPWPFAGLRFTAFAVVTLQRATATRESDSESVLACNALLYLRREEGSFRRVL
jgi:hypothetical protein